MKLGEMILIGIAFLALFGLVVLVFTSSWAQPQYVGSFFKVGKATVTPTATPIPAGLSVGLNSPANGAVVNRAFPVWLNFTPYSVGAGNFTNFTLFVEYPAANMTWQAADNASSSDFSGDNQSGDMQGWSIDLSNVTENPDGVITWNVQVCNATDCVFAVSNYSFTVTTVAVLANEQQCAFLDNAEPNYSPNFDNEPNRFIFKQQMNESENKVGFYFNNKCGAYTLPANQVVLFGWDLDNNVSTGIEISNTQGNGQQSVGHGFWAGLDLLMAYVNNYTGVDLGSGVNFTDVTGASFYCANASVIAGDPFVGGGLDSWFNSTTPNNVTLFTSNSSGGTVNFSQSNQSASGPYALHIQQPADNQGFAEFAANFTTPSSFRLSAEFKGVGTPYLLMHDANNTIVYDWQHSEWDSWCGWNCSQQTDWVFLPAPMTGGWQGWQFGTIDMLNNQTSVVLDVSATNPSGNNTAADFYIDSVELWPDSGNIPMTMLNFSNGLFNGVAECNNSFNGSTNVPTRIYLNQSSGAVRAVLERGGAWLPLPTFRAVMSPGGGSGPNDLYFTTFENYAQGINGVPEEWAYTQNFSNFNDSDFRIYANSVTNQQQLFINVSNGTEAVYAFDFDNNASTGDNVDKIVNRSDFVILASANQSGDGIVVVFGCWNASIADYEPIDGNLTSLPYSCTTSDGQRTLWITQRAISNSSDSIQAELEINESGSWNAQRICEYSPDLGGLATCTTFDVSTTSGPLAVFYYDPQYPSHLAQDFFGNTGSINFHFSTDQEGLDDLVGGNCTLWTNASGVWQPITTLYSNTSDFGFDWLASFHSLNSSQDERVLWNILCQGTHNNASFSQWIVPSPDFNGIRDSPITINGTDYDQENGGTVSGGNASLWLAHYGAFGETRLSDNPNGISKTNGTFIQFGYGQLLYHSIMPSCQLFTNESGIWTGYEYDRTYYQNDGTPVVTTPDNQYLNLMQHLLNVSGGTPSAADFILNDPLTVENSSNWFFSLTPNFNYSFAGGDLMFNSTVNNSAQPVGAAISNYTSIDTSRDFNLTVDTYLADTSATLFDSNISVAQVDVESNSLSEILGCAIAVDSSGNYSLALFNESNNPLLFAPTTYSSPTLNLFWNASAQEITCTLGVDSLSTTSNNSFSDGKIFMGAALAGMSGPDNITGENEVHYENFYFEQLGTNGSTTSLPAQVDWNVNCSATFCDGTPQACNTFTNLTACYAQSGCYWSGSCFGSPVSCSAITNMTLCPVHLGCSANSTSWYAPSNHSFTAIAATSGADKFGLPSYDLTSNWNEAKIPLIDSVFDIGYFNLQPYSDHIDESYLPISTVAPAFQFNTLHPILNSSIWCRQSSLALPVTLVNYSTNSIWLSNLNTSGLFPNFELNCSYWWQP